MEENGEADKLSLSSTIHAWRGDKWETETQAMNSLWFFANHDQIKRSDDGVGKKRQRAV